MNLTCFLLGLWDELASVQWEGSFSQAVSRSLEIRLGKDTDVHAEDIILGTLLLSESIIDLQT